MQVKLQQAAWTSWSYCLVGRTETDLRLLEEVEVEAEAEEVELVVSSGRPAVHQNEMSS